jgi:hypothetical protein
VIPFDIGRKADLKEVTMTAIIRKTESEGAQSSSVPRSGGFFE